jgi:AcrR family transcriptional regulator
MRLPAEQRRRQLLDVGLDIFAERGFHSTSMDEVALAAGVTKPVLYQHFPSKRALYVELLEDVGNQLLTQLTSATDQASTGRQRVEEGFGAYFRFVGENRSAFRLLFGASVRNDPEFAEVADRFIDRATAAVSTLIQIPVPEEHRLMLANALVGIAEATSRRSLARGDGVEGVDSERLAAWIAEFAWFGLRGVRAGDDVATSMPGPR